MRTNDLDDLPRASHPASLNTMAMNSLEVPEFPFNKINDLPKFSYALENLMVSLVSLLAAFLDCVLTIYVWMPIGLARSCVEVLIMKPLLLGQFSQDQVIIQRSQDDRDRNQVVVVISGASSGIGASLVKIYASNPNHILILLGRNPSRLNRMAKFARISGCKAVETHSIDYSHESSQDSIRNLLLDTYQKYGSIDILFSNAGTATFTDDNPLGPEPWGEKTVARLTKINVVSSYSFIMTAWEIMKKQGSGNICITSSILGFQSPPAFAAYSAAKANLLSFSQSLRALSTPYGIKVHCICPGFVETGLSQDLIAAGSTVPSFLMGDSNDLARRMKEAVDDNHSIVIWPISHGLANIFGARFNWLNNDLTKWCYSKAGLNGQMVS